LTEELLHSGRTTNQIGEKVVRAVKLDNAFGEGYTN
jgi:hypothetical protein